MPDQVRGIDPVGLALSAIASEAAFQGQLDHFGSQAGFAQPGLSGDGDDLPFALQGQLQPLGGGGQLLPAPDHRPGVDRLRQPGALRLRQAGQAVDGDGLRLALDGDGRQHLPLKS